MRYTLICLLAMLVVCSGCQTAKIKPKKLPLARGVQTIAQTNIDNRVDPALLALPVEPYRLGPGDVIKVEMPQISGSGERTTVGPDGKVYYSIIAGVNVWGMTLSEAKAAMEKGLEALYRRPVVSVTLVTVESQRFWILGRVKSPGSYPLATPTTLLEAIAGANGFETTFSAGSTEEVADVKHSFVVRDGNMLPVNFTQLFKGDMNQNIYLKADDMVYIPSSSANEIYCLGAVQAPSRIPYGEHMTLTAVLAKVHGPAELSNMKQVAILRGSLTSPEIAVIDANKILTGKEPDVMLEPHDIVYVPSSPYRTVERYAKLIADAFVRTVAANSGGAAGSKYYQSIGVSQPVQ